MRPSSASSSSVDGWIVSPRKSRRKSLCFSRTTTSTPARARRKPRTAPAGPQPAIAHVVLVVDDSDGIDRVYVSTKKGGGRERPPPPYRLGPSFLAVHRTHRDVPGV